MHAVSQTATMLVRKYAATLITSMTLDQLERMVGIQRVGDAPNLASRFRAFARLNPTVLVSCSLQMKFYKKNWPEYKKSFQHSNSLKP